MKKTELIKLTENCNLKLATCKRLRTCTARVYEPIDYNFDYILKSYNTIVATVINGVCYVFDYWSQTTSQHISKFIKDYGIEHICYLYERSDRVCRIDRGIKSKYPPKRVYNPLNDDYAIVI